MKLVFFPSKILRYRHFKICNFSTLCLKFIELWLIVAHQTRLIFYTFGHTFIMHWETRGRLRSWRNSHFTISSIIDHFPKKCSLRSTVQAGPILFYQVIGRLPRYVMLKYFWICKSLLPFDFLNILIPFRTLCYVLFFCVGLFNEPLLFPLPTNVAVARKADEAHLTTFMFWWWLLWLFCFCIFIKSKDTFAWHTILVAHSGLGSVDLKF